MGQVAGDSLGSLVEFQDLDEIEQRYPGGPRRLENGGVWGTLAGQPTDDSEMALALARSLLAMGRFDHEAVFRVYQEWMLSGPFDIGGTTRAALSSGIPRPDSQANGCLMRISPLGIFGAGRSADDLWNWASADASLTHPHPICVACTAVFACAIAYAIDAGEGPDAVYSYAVSLAGRRSVDPAVRQALESARNQPPLDFLRSQGWVLIAFQNAFYRLLHAASFEDGVVETVRCGGDTDTNAAIAGALLGAVSGLEAIPRQWRDSVLSCRPGYGFPGVRRPRLEQYWPVDVLDIAERLLA
jgi:ADP-ribosylglycohydrolase